MEAPPTTVDTAPVTGGVAPTRGRGGSMRGSYDGRGRGRGMGRGSYSGMGGPGGYSGRGGYGPRGGGMTSSPMGYQGRGGFAPRGAPPMRGAPSMGGPGGYSSRGGYQGGAPRGGPPMRGSGRPPLYSQPPKQHTGVDNNKTISPVQASANNQVVAIKADNDVGGTEEAAQAVNADPNVLQTTSQQVAPPLMSKPLISGPSPNYRGRGRGGGPRGGGRGGYNGSTGGYNGSTGGMMTMHGAPMQEHGMPRRGGPPRGRGSYQGTGMTQRPLMHQPPHVVNTQMPPQSLKRGAPGGPPGPKRGRYETGPYSQRAPTPKYHQAPHIAQQTTSYGVAHQPAPPPQQTHHYQSHVTTPAMDPYAQSYAAPQTQTTYNGYGQTSSYTHAAPTHAATHQANNAYAATEYDQSQYQGYSSTYGQQDTRYQNYGQDYTQQYGAPAVDYNTSQADYSQHAQQTYDERAYAGYDTQSYQQSYSNAGYY